MNDDDNDATDISLAKNDLSLLQKLLQQNYYMVMVDEIFAYEKMLSSSISVRHIISNRDYYLNKLTKLNKLP